MNTTFKSALRIVVACVALVTLGVLCLVSPPRARADNQGFPTTLMYPTNMPVFVTASSVSNSLASWIKIPSGGRGMALTWQFKMSASSTATEGLYISPLADGTNASTLLSWPLQAAANGTTVQTVTTNWARGTLDGYQYLVITAQTNGAASAIYATNVSLTVSYPNN